MRNLSDLPLVLLSSLPMLPRVIVSGYKQENDYLYLNNPSNKGGFVEEYVKDNAAENPDHHEQPVVTPLFLLDQPFFRFVAFYSPACPHCVHYAPEYIRIAQQIKTEEEIDGVKFHAVSCKVHRTLCRQFPLHGFPTILAIPSGNNATSGASVMKQFLKVDSFLKALNIETVPQSAFRRDAMEQYTKPYIKSILPYEGNVSLELKRQLIFQDAATSFYFTLTNEIFMEVGPLSHQKRAAFTNFLTVLQYTLPSDHSSMRKLLNLVDDLMGHLEDVMNDEGMLLHFVKAHLPLTGSTDLEWSEACTHGQSSMGYTCGLWELFHIMTVGITVHLSAWNSVDITAKFVGDSIRDFVHHFFGCRECSTHFVQMYDTCQQDVCHRLLPSRDWREAALWLWEAHNDVNVRLARERMDRHGEGITLPTNEILHDALWPSRKECPKCWISDNSWDSSIVYNYLKSTYWYGIHPDRSNEAVANKEESKAQLVIRLSKDKVHFVLISIFVCLLALSLLRYRQRRRKLCGLHKKLDLPWTTRRDE
jgi:thiol-disulfide isomerase/thioredoxin